MRKHILWIAMLCIFLALVGTVLGIVLPLKKKLVNGNISVAIPDQIAIFDHSYTPMIWQKDSIELVEFYNLFQSSGKTNKLEETMHDFEVNENITQELDKNIPWELNTKKNNIVVEFRYNEKQVQKIWIENNSKLIEFYSLIFVLDGEDIFKTTYIYFRTTENTDMIIDPVSGLQQESIGSNPIVVCMNQVKMKTYISEKIK